MLFSFMNRKFNTRIPFINIFYIFRNKMVYRLLDIGGRPFVEKFFF